MGFIPIWGPTNIPTSWTENDQIELNALRNAPIEMANTSYGCFLAQHKRDLERAYQKMLPRGKWTSSGRWHRSTRQVQMMGNLCHLASLPFSLMSLMSKLLHSTFLSILLVLIDLCMRQSWWPRIATNASILQHLKMGPVLATEGGSYQTETYTPSQQCVEANGVGAWVSNNGKWTNKSAV